MVSSLVGIVVFAIVAAFALVVLSLMCCCTREVIEDKSSSEDLASLFPEVSAKREE